MSSYSLTDETSIDVLIFWIESSDGSISFAEQATVKRALENMRYDFSTFQTTLSHIAAMSTQSMLELVDEAIDHVKSSFSDDGQRMVYQLLDAVASCDGKLNKTEIEKLNHVKEEFGI